MGNPAIYFKPDGSSTWRSFQLPHGLTRFTGLRDEARQMNVALSGVSHTVVWDSYDRFLVECRAISRDSSSYNFSRLTSWWSHAARGGTFAFALDSDKTGNTTLSSAASEGDTTLSVADASDFSAGDWILIEHDDDPTKWERRKISSVGTGSITVSTAVLYDYPSGSTVRHADYFPKCVVESAKTPLKEREAGRGVNLWDLVFTFRLVR